MTAGRCTHDLEFHDDVVIKRYASWERGEPRREWQALTLLAEHAPGLGPVPVRAALDGRPPVIVMSRLPGRVLRGEQATGEQIQAVAAAVNRLHRLPRRVVETFGPAPWGPAAAVAKARFLAGRRPELGDDPVVREAYRAGVAWLDSAAPDGLAADPRPPVLGMADGNRANYLWDEHDRRVRLVDWEDSGRNDRAFELGELCEHISRLDGDLDARRLLALVDLTPEEARRVRDFRLLIALGWFLQLGPGGPAAPHNPPGALAVQAARVLRLLGQHSPG